MAGIVVKVNPYYKQERLLYVDEEPVGVKVNPYYKQGRISHILNARAEDKVDVIRNSPFSKFFELAYIILGM
ncbi:hypothetical protein HID58_038090 [Brassica napus]|uniref:Uncharacterized protein n=1 Tax=Brassica napus TaxID=3708 RepID=A0ABQ8BPG9_BRANA|nr:hypothetical protein HID58_038090 [Brassica napus]